MKKRFNTTGSCNPEWHYMVDTSAKLAKIEEYIDDGLYFTINRARQFGKPVTFDTPAGAWENANSKGAVAASPSTVSDSSADTKYGIMIMDVDRE